MSTRRGKIGFYGTKTRVMQRKLTFELFGLTYKTAKIYLYLGSRATPLGHEGDHEPSITDVYTKVFYEVPDRAYSSEFIEIPIGADDFSQSSMDFSRFGVISPMTSEHNFKVHMDDFQAIGRRLIAGDVFEIPFLSETGKEGSFWEITDVDNKREPEDFMNTISAIPLSESRTTHEVPIDDSNDDVLTGIMGEFDREVEEDVKTDQPTYSEPEDVEEFEYRTNNQQRFMDRFD